VDAVSIVPLSAGTVEGFRALALAGLAEYGLSDEGLEADLQGPLLDNYEAAWVAVLGGEVLGTVAVERRADGDLHLMRMFVSTRLRGRGIGTALLDYALAHARNTGTAAVHLETLSVMKAAHHIYERAGFEPVGTSTYGGNCDVQYTLRLR
jgi:ribosomal protein S18 acetylase RimI-like enzyme